MSGSAVLKRPAAKRITVFGVRDALLVVVAEHPGRADRRAVDGVRPRYVDRGRPVGLVAMVLVRLGYSTGVLTALDHEHPIGAVCTFESGVRVDESRHPALRKIDPLARLMLRYIQDMQDSGYRWERILRAALTPNLLGAWADRKRKPWLHRSE